MTHTFDLRRHERFRVEPMYTSVTVQVAERMRVRNVEGHLYDVSEAGARIELDVPLQAGIQVAMSLRLPGEAASIFVTGQVVWCADGDDDPGPRRMAIAFSRFLTPADRARLNTYLGSGYATRAA